MEQDVVDAVVDQTQELGSRMPWVLWRWQGAYLRLKDLHFQISALGVLAICLKASPQPV